MPGTGDDVLQQHGDAPGAEAGVPVGDTLPLLAAMAWEQMAGLGRHIGTADPDEVLAAIVEIAASFGFGVVVICKIDAARSTYRYELSHGLSGDLAAVEHPLSVGMPGRVVAGRRSVVVAEYDRMPSATPELVALGVKTAMAAPLWVEGEVAAVLAVGYLEHRRIDDREIAAVEALAAHGSRVLESATMLRRERLGAARLAALLQATPDALVTIDRAGTIVEASAQCAAVFGHSPEQLVGRPLEVLVPERLRARHTGEVKGFLARPSGARCRAPLELQALRADGSEFPAEISLSYAEAAGEVYVVAATRDVTERKLAVEDLAYRASHDRLTGLLNRSGFVERLDAALARAVAGCPPVTVCLLDVDRFKLVNDSLGHSVGDLFLVEVAERLRSLVSPPEAPTGAPDPPTGAPEIPSSPQVSLARFGGDEFAVLAEGIGGAGEAESFAQSLLGAFERPFVMEGIEVYASASAGVVLGASGDDTATLLQYVDAALYRAKDAGRGRSEMFDQALATAAAERLDTVAGLHRALAERELRAYYQPVVTLPEGRMVGVEALVRWEHPTQGLLGPVAFLDAAEDSGLMVPLGRFMLEQACTDVARWRRDHEEAASMTVHVNLSGRQLEHPDVCSDVESALAASGLPPDALVLEVTESVFVAEISGATARLAELKSLGVRLGLDDFGTGYSSLSFLASVPFDVLKIDKSFVDRLADGSSPVIEAVATLAAALGLELVAEGVEHQAQVGRLVGLGCRLAQGFYFSRPVDHVAIEAMVSSGGVPGRCMTE